MSSWLNWYLCLLLLLIWIESCFDIYVICVIDCTVIKEGAIIYKTCMVQKKVFHIFSMRLLLCSIEVFVYYCCSTAIRTDIFTKGVIFILIIHLKLNQASVEKTCNVSHYKLDGFCSTEILYFILTGSNNILFLYILQLLLNNYENEK